MFYAADPNGAKELSCGGNEENLSDIKGDHYLRCESSSFAPSGEYNCDSGLNGKMEDNPFALWATDGEGV